MTSSQSLEHEEEVFTEKSLQSRLGHDTRQTDVTLLELMFSMGMGIKMDRTRLWTIIGEDFWSVMTQTYAIMGSGMNPRSRRLLMELLGFGMSMATEGAPEKREEIVSSLVQSLHSVEEGSSQSDEMLVAPEDSLLVELIAAEILQHPMESTISNLVSHLKQGRFSVLVIFEAILRVPTSSLGVNVIDSIVALLHHERLSVRKGAIRVLSLTNPRICFDRLIALLQSESIQERSAAEETISQVLLVHHRHGEAMDCFLDALVGTVVNPARDVSSPAELFQKYESTRAEREKGSNPNRDRLLNLVPKWASRMSLDMLDDIGAKSAIRLLDNPSDETFVMLFSALVPFLPASVHIRTLQTAFNHLEKSIFRDELSVFEKLSPLLLMKMIPHRSYEKWEDARHGMIVLRKTMTDRHQPSQVREVAAFVAACFPVPFVQELMFQDFVELFEDVPGNIKEIGGFMYCFCSAMMMRWKEQNAIFSIREISNELLPWSLLILCAHWDGADESSIIALQRGAMELMACMVHFDILSKSNSMDEEESSSRKIWIDYLVKVVRSEDGWKEMVEWVPNLKEIFPRVQHAQDTTSGLSEDVNICLVNVITRWIQLEDVHILQDRRSSILNELLLILSKGRLNGACFQSIFHLLYRVEDVSLLEWRSVYNSIVHSLKDGLSDQDTRLWSLRCLTGLIRSSRFESVGDEIVKDVVRLLQNISMMDSSPQLRQTAEQLVRVFTPEE
eukprot:TRINITY_DN8718_c0_g1_i4.p1 TRINITY_DN8718_c0_g1~~TRINITY_DN8718_c0_g1_i4.p1  ORF type:complete len:731 (-),score=198.84 TRINITY_DN8718_c0_g1_i4:1193-3385(-)